MLALEVLLHGGLHQHGHVVELADVLHILVLEDGGGTKEGRANKKSKLNVVIKLRTKDTVFPNATLVASNSNIRMHSLTFGVQSLGASRWTGRRRGR